MSLFPRAFQEFSPLLTLINDYDKAARSAFADVPDATFFRPKFDVKESKDSYELHGELPGLEQKDVSIEWSDSNTLTISGHTESYREEGTKPKQVKASVEEVPEHEGKHSTAVTTQDKSGDVVKADEGPKYWLSERSVGQFRRNFSFPARVEQDAVKASLKNGILSIVVPKARGGAKKKVEIE
ncbi:HSP20-like chaperone [Venturia nashicola]|uniref:HSP20-like chaperone n=1 Tax=Venturia nashicola TaxID=86259 RepID=A0A4Z1NZT4_9PEZI|nr:HSP20-like chaperone [Venturia nashicola]TLD18282.1 HSP20-like chaperone [Venturia nashicola]